MIDERAKTTADGRRFTDARIHARSSFVVGRKKKNTHHQGTKTPREESQGGRGGKGGKSGVRSKESGVRSQACRGDLALIPHLSSIIRNSNREAREERFHHKGTEGTKGKRCKAEAQRSRRKEGCGVWIIRPCFKPSVVRVMPGHGGKILTTENTEDTENRWLALFIRPYLFRVCFFCLTTGITGGVSRPVDPFVGQTLQQQFKTGHRAGQNRFSWQTPVL
jgi:hypothetical protein